MTANTIESLRLKWRASPGLPPFRKSHPALRLLLFSLRYRVNAPGGGGPVREASPARRVADGVAHG